MKTTKKGTNMKPNETIISKLIKVTMIGLASLAMLACGAGGQRSSDTGSSNEVFSLTGVDGDWATDCIVQAGSTSLRSFYEFDRSPLVHVQTNFYQNTTCSGQQSSLQEITYFVKKYSPSGTPDLVNADWQVNVDDAIMYGSQAEIDQLNQINFCGRNDWVYGQPRSIAGGDCFGARQPASYSTLYTILKVNGTELQVGTSTPSQNGTTPAERHTNLGIQLTFENGHSYPGQN